MVCQAPLLPTKGPAFRFYFYLLFLQPISTSKRLTCPLLIPKWIVSTKRSISASLAASPQRLPVLTLGYCFSEISAEEGILSSNAPTAHATSQLWSPAHLALSVAFASRRLGQGGADCMLAVTRILDSFQGGSQTTFSFSLFFLSRLFSLALYAK